MARPRGQYHRPVGALVHDQVADRNRAVEATLLMLQTLWHRLPRPVARERPISKWRGTTQMAFRRLEDRGEIRGGRFVDGFGTVRLPVAVESLGNPQNAELEADYLVGG